MCARSAHCVKEKAEVPQVGGMMDQAVHVPAQETLHVPMFHTIHKHVEVPQVVFEVVDDSVDEVNLDTACSHCRWIVGRRLSWPRLSPSSS